MMDSMASTTRDDCSISAASLSTSSDEAAASKSRKRSRKVEGFADDAVPSTSSRAQLEDSDTPASTSSPRPTFLPSPPGVPRPAIPTRLTAPVHIDIGGSIYTSTLATLTKFPGSRLAHMFNGTDPIILDTMKQHYFIDRDGPSFRHILTYLRNGKLSLSDDFSEWEILEDECRFYQIDAMLQEIIEAKGRTVDCIILLSNDNSLNISGKRAIIADLFFHNIDTEIENNNVDDLYLNNYSLPAEEFNLMEVMEKLFAAKFTLASSSATGIEPVFRQYIFYCNN